MFFSFHLHNMASICRSCYWWGFVCWFIGACFFFISFSLKCQRLGPAEGRMLGDWRDGVLAAPKQASQYLSDISYSHLAVLGATVGFVVVCTENLRFFSMILGGFYVFWHVGQTFWGFLSTSVHTRLQCWKSVGDCPLLQKKSNPEQFWAGIFWT